MDFVACACGCRRDYSQNLLIRRLRRFLIQKLCDDQRGVAVTGNERPLIEWKVGDRRPDFVGASLSGGVGLEKVRHLHAIERADDVGFGRQTGDPVGIYVGKFRDRAGEIIDQRQALGIKDTLRTIVDDRHDNWIFEPEDIAHMLAVENHRIILGDEGIGTRVFMDFRHKRRQSGNRQ